MTMVREWHHEPPACYPGTGDHHDFPDEEYDEEVKCRRCGHRAICKTKLPDQEQLELF